ncbi:MAG TPA: T9SS type A sorting domain-containing protein, partial [Chitinophagaceae bacterium]|nr:T9SS type A sorting domain-containing protein [Chitinophagaceae bacterium]
MFYYATSFNQAIGNWQLNQNVNLNVMLSHSGMDCSTYSTTLNGWSNNPNIPVNRQLAASNLTFGLNIQNDRNYLINTKGWTISGDTMNNVNCCVSSFYTYNASACNSYFFNGQSLVNSGTYYDTLVNANGCDSLLTLNLTINQNGFTINDSACISYSFNGLIISSSGTYFDTLVNVNGCDSLITLNLTINQVDTSVTQSGASLTANASGATYQWLTCNPFQEIIGETSQNFIASNNGDYAVVVSQNGCTDTSSCYVVIGIGYNNFDLSNNIKIFPNPFNQVLQIEAEHVLQNAEIKLLNTLGQSIATFSHISDKTYTIDLSALAPGSYFIQIKDAKHNFVQKLRKE